MARIGRIFAILLAFLVSGLVAAVVLSGAIMTRVAMVMPQAGLDWMQIPGVAVAAFVPILAATIVPASIVIGLTEIYRVRAFWVYPVAGALIGLVGILSLRLGLNYVFAPVSGSAIKPPAMIPAISESWIFLLPGLVSGAVYWRLAGRKAGVARDQRELQKMAGLG